MKFIVWIIFNTAIGKNIIKFYLQKEINHYFNNIKIEKLIINYNTFSVLLNQNDNIYKLYGEIFPFDAIIDGRLKYIDLANKKIKENATISGNVVKKITGYLINSTVYFDNNIGFLKIKLNKSTKDINFKTGDIDLGYVLNKLSVKIPKNLNGKVKINLSSNNYNYNIYALIKGFYQKIPFNSNINVFFNSFNNININGKIKSKILEGNFKATVDNKNNIKYIVDLDKLDLKLFPLMYPFKGEVSLKAENNPEYGIIKFKGNNFSGFYDQNITNIVFDMPSDMFFNYINLPDIFDYGKITGRIVVSDKGSFNFLIQNAGLKEDILKKLNIKYDEFEKIFVKGTFNKKEVVFDLLCDKNDLTISIKKGKLLIKGDKIIPVFVLNVNDGKDLYIYKFKNNRLKLLKKENLNNENNQILVF
ncbi:hypothetical protein [Lebetimonas sp. JH292]|uniref:hypothetical protein n=1 Tax=Lebetimonas sp. JH292 TaxID=990068 RepID=UPI0004670E8E|nr:hypothetical protein [Lebetimonas sp. JH292]